VHFVGSGKNTNTKSDAKPGNTATAPLTITATNINARPGEALVQPSPTDRFLPHNRSRPQPQHIFQHNPNRHDSLVHRLLPHDPMPDTCIHGHKRCGIFPNPFCPKCAECQRVYRTCRSYKPQEEHKGWVFQIGKWHGTGVMCSAICLDLDHDFGRDTLALIDR
jgi:hypothetical protein